jgi:type 1 fimbria pilin
MWGNVVRKGWLFLFCFMMGVEAFAAFEPNKGVAKINISGLLYTPACVLDHDNITIDFGTVTDKNLYVDGRIESRPFFLGMTCAASDGAELDVVFRGVQSAALPGYLQINPPGMGAVIGVEKIDGTFVELDKKITAGSVSAGRLIMKFRAFLKGEPQAIASHSIQKGQFTAAAYFVLNYH